MIIQKFWGPTQWSSLKGSLDIVQKQIGFSNLRCLLEPWPANENSEFKHSVSKAKQLDNKPNPRA